MFKRLFTILLVLIVGTLAVAGPIWAAETKVDDPLAKDSLHTALRDDAKISLNPFGYKSVPGILGIFARWFIGLLGSVTMIMYVYAGILWMTAAGNSEKISKAGSILLWTSLAVIVALGSYVIVDFIFNLAQV